MLTPLENVKHQIKLSTVMNLFMSRLNTAGESASEMPDDISFPLSSPAEVDCCEDWLSDPANAVKKKQMVYILQTPHIYYIPSVISFSLFFFFAANSIPYFYRSLCWLLLGGHDIKHVTGISLQIVLPHRSIGRLEVNNN